MGPDAGHRGRPARGAPGAACGGWEGDSPGLLRPCSWHPAVAPQVSVTGSSPGSGGRWDAEHRGAPRCDHHSGGHSLDPEFPSPHLGSGCSPVPGDFVLLPGQLLLLVGVSGLVFRGAARPPLYSLARADPRAGAQRNCQLISVCAAAQSSHPAKRWASWKPLPGPVPSR